MAIHRPEIVVGVAALYRVRLDAFHEVDLEAYDDLRFFCRKVMEGLYPDFLNDPDYPNSFATETPQESLEEAINDAASCQES